MIQEAPSSYLQTIPGAQLDLNDEQELIEFIRRINIAGTEHLRSWYRNAELNLAWTAGEQYLLPNPENGELGRDPRFEKALKTPIIYTNLLRPYVINKTVRVIQSPHTWRTRPRTGDESDIASATTLDKLLPYWWDVLRTADPSGYERALHFLFCTGIVFLSPTWDTESGEQKIIPADVVQKRIDRLALGNEIDGDEGFAALVKSIDAGANADRIHRDDEGNIVLQLGAPDLHWYNGWQVIEDFRATRWSDCEWVLIKERIPLEKALELYPDQADDLVAQRQVDFEQPYRPRRDRQLSSDDQGQRVFEQVEIDVLWRRPSKAYPGGWKASVTNQVVLDKGEHPYRHRDLPVIPIVESPDPNGIRPTPAMDDLIVLQQHINTLDQQIIEHIALTVDPNVLAEQGAINPVEFFQRDPGIRWFNTGRREPVPWPVESMAPHVIRQKEMLIQIFKELAGLTDPSQGRPSGEAKSGRAIGFLNERQDRQGLVYLRSIQSGLGAGGQQFIQLWAEFGSDEETIQIVGEEGRPDLATLKGEDVLSQGQNDGRPGISRFDVEVEIGEQPSRAQAVEEVDFLIERQVLRPFEHDHLIIRAMREGHLPDLDETKQDRSNAAWENEQFSALNDRLVREGSQGTEVGDIQPGMLVAKDPETGQYKLPIVEPRPGEDARTHIRVHFKFAKNREKWDKLHEAVKQRFVEHVGVHLAELQQQMLEQQQAAEIAGTNTPNRSGNNGQGSAQPGITKPERATATRR